MLHGGCVGCAYNTFPQLKVENVDNAACDLLVIGDIPIAQEVLKGRTMQGPARHILAQALDQISLPKDLRIKYITAVACSVPKAKGTTIRKEILNCRHFLIDRVRQIQPKAILLLGKTAYQVWCGDFGVKISEQYGRFATIPELDIPAMAVYNPGTILKSPGDFKPFVQMLLKFKNHVFASDVYDPGVTKWKVVGKEGIHEFIEALKKHSYPKGHIWGADIETTDIDYRVAEFLVLGLSPAKNVTYVIPRECMEHLREIFQILEDSGQRVAWQHGKYDKKVLWRRGLADVTLHEDTMYQHYLLDETGEHNLGFLTKMYLNAEEYKFKMNQNFKAVTLDTYESFFDSLVERVAVDADLTLQLCHKLHEEIGTEENKSLLNIYRSFIMPVANFLARLEQNGVLIDEGYLEAMGVDYQNRLEDVLKEIQQEALYVWSPEQYMHDMQAKSAPKLFNPASPKQMSWMVFKKLKLRPRVRKAQSTSAEVLESIENPPPLIQLVLKYRGIAKEYSTYVQGLLKRRDVDGRVRANFNLAGTATGRLSCKEPNLQNLPSYFGVGNVRRACIAPKGYVLAEVDYSGAELRWLAVLSGDENLTAIFVEDRDLHSETAKLMFGEDYTKQDRMRAKAVNFGIMYGRQANSFKDEFNISIEEAQEIVDSWFRAYPKAYKYLKWCEHMVDTGQYIQSPFGNRRRFGLVSDAAKDGLHNEAKNFAIQCASSHLLLYCCTQLETTLAERGVRLINMVHDSTLMEIPDDEETVRWATNLMGETMATAPLKLFGTKVPFKYDIDLGVDWGNLTGFNAKTGMVKDTPYKEWLESNKHEDIFNQGWYKDIEEHLDKLANIRGKNRWN